MRKTRALAIKRPPGRRPYRGKNSVGPASRRSIRTQQPWHDLRIWIRASMEVSEKPAPVLVMIHSPLIGPAIWRRCGDLLQRKGCQVRIPSLADLVAGGQQRDRYAAPSLRLSRLSARLTGMLKACLAARRRGRGCCLCRRGSLAVAGARFRPKYRPARSMRCACRGSTRGRSQPRSPTESRAA